MQVSGMIEEITIAGLTETLSKLQELRRWLNPTLLSLLIYTEFQLFFKKLGVQTSLSTCKLVVWCSQVVCAHSTARTQR